MHHTKPRFLHLSSFFLLITLIITSCSPSVPPVDVTPYPSYDPFAPVGATNAPLQPIQPGQVIVATRTPGGATPTRAALSVVVPTRDPKLSTPTPDAPHQLPASRQVTDSYTVQAGDTLGTIAQGYGITLEALIQANPSIDPNLISVGMVLTIPPITEDPNPGSSFKIVPDSELVYSPGTIQFDADAYLKTKGGYLSNYIQEVNGNYMSAAEIIMRIARNYSVNPRLLIALIEYRSGWVNNQVPDNIDYPLGFFDANYSGLNKQLAWAADNMNRGYYLWRANALATLPLNDGSYVPLSPTINAGTAGMQYFFAKFNDRATWDLDVSEDGFYRIYGRLFGDPFNYDFASLIPFNLTQPPMQLPFQPSVTWSFTGGPHGGWDSGSAWAALDFAPPGEGGGCEMSQDWAVAIADGLIVRSNEGAVVQDLDNDGYEQTGWTVLYMHMDSVDRVKVGTYVYAGDPIGHPSCEGGVSNATHLHLARRFNGEWIAADGNLPFNLDGWISSGNGTEYDGYLTRGTTVIEAWEGVLDGVNQIAR
jgi:murein DD-endopeptidase MepM/ murein hydrolase activator NlpD